ANATVSTSSAVRKPKIFTCTAAPANSKAITSLTSPKCQSRCCPCCVIVGKLRPNRTSAACPRRRRSRPSVRRQQLVDDCGIVFEARNQSLISQRHELLAGVALAVAPRTGGPGKLQIEASELERLGFEIPS